MELDLDNKEFQQVMTLINYTSQSVFMTGKAGTGKSTFLKYITETTHKNYVVLAPTGIAAVNAGGQTLHSFFKLPLKPLLPDDPEFDLKRLRERMKYPGKFIKMLKGLELIIIDEISMVRADTIDFIDKLLRFFCGNSRQPFAGKQILMVGDVFQLEPVVTADAREILRHHYNNFFFFSAHVFQQFSLVPIELRKVYRQSDETFIGLLDRVRAGRPTRADLNELNRRVTPEGGTDSDSGMTMTIATRRDIVDSINEAHLEKIERPAFTFEAEVTGDFPESSFPTDRNLTLKEGAQVVFIRNAPDHTWVNGTLGRVTALSDEELRVTLENGNTVDLEREVWDNVVYGYDEEKRTVTETVKGSFVQFPVKLAWALTIHKSQGLTFSQVRIDVGAGAFAGGQTYVALSRCRSLEGMHLHCPLRPSDIYVNPHVVNFARMFNNGRLITDALAAARADSLYAQAAHAFDACNYTLAVDSFIEAVGARNELGNRLTRKLMLRKLHELDSNRLRADRAEAEARRLRDTIATLASEFVDMGLTCLNESWEAEAALANFDKALRLTPGLYEARVGRARALALLGEAEQARDILGEASTDCPDRYEAPYQLGALFLSAGDVSNAVNFLNKAQKAKPDEPAIHDALADAFEAAGDEAQARRHRRRAVTLRKKDKH